MVGATVSSLSSSTTEASVGAGVVGLWASILTRVCFSCWDGFRWVCWDLTRSGSGSAGAALTGCLATKGLENRSCKGDKIREGRCRIGKGDRDLGHQWVRESIEELLGQGKLAKAAEGGKENLKISVIL